MIAATGNSAEDMLRILLAMVDQVEVRGDTASDGPPEDTRTPRDPDGLHEENRATRQARWFE